MIDQNPQVQWTPTTRERYYEMLEVLPPIAWKGGAFLVSEPVDHAGDQGRARFDAFRESPTGLSYDASSRAVTVAELNANRGRTRGEVWQ